MRVTLRKNESGYPFPVGPDDDLLAWSPGLYNTPAEEAKGYPRLLIVLKAMQEHRPDQFLREIGEIERACIGNPIFGPAAKRFREACKAALGANYPNGQMRLWSSR